MSRTHDVSTHCHGHCGPLPPRLFLYPCLLLQVASSSLLTTASAASEPPPASTTTTRTLVLSDNISIQQTHADFFQNMRNRGHVLTFKLVDELVNLYDREQQQLMYSNMLLLAPEAEDLLGSLDTDPVTQFIQRGGNVFITAAPSDTSFLIHELATNCGVQLRDTTTTMTASTKRPATFSNLQQSDALVGGTFVNTEWPGMESAELEWNVLYHGVTMSRASPLRQDTIQYRGSEEHLSKSYYTSLLATSSMKQTQAKTKTQNQDLVVAVEATNGARVVVSGAFSMCSNALYKHEQENHNEAFCNLISSWAFEKVGQLRTSVEIQKIQMQQGDATGVVRQQRSKAMWSAGVAQPLRTYTSNETISIRMTLEEAFSLVQDGGLLLLQWKAHDASLYSIHINIVSLGKIIFTTKLKKGDQSSSSALYTGSIRLPSTYGAYTLQVLYERPGYSVVEKRMEFHIAPFSHISTISNHISTLGTVAALVIGVVALYFGGKK